MFSLDTTGTEMLMRREAEGLTLQTVHGCDTITKRGKRSESGWLYSTEYQSRMKKMYHVSKQNSIVH